MASGQWAVVLRHVQRLFHGGSVSGLTEGQLLDRFVASRDEVAFGAIVARHGPMVLGVCRGVLDDPHDVEDAFQATFLVLVRKAGGLRDRELLGPWLYGVARRVALRARAEARKRRTRERPGVEAESKPVATFDAELRELQVLVREEVDRLPSHDRMAVVFCYLEGLTHEEAADRLGWPVGTVKGRLSRARDKLRDRLSRRGVSLPAVFALTPPGGIPTIVPISLIASTTLAAARLAAGQTLTAGIVSAQAISLMEGVIGTMFTTKLKIAAAALAATCAVAVPGVMAFQGQGPAFPPAEAPKPKAGPPRVEAGGGLAVPKAADIAAARKVSAEFADQALKMIDQLRAKGLTIPESAYADWSRRLAETTSAPGVPPAERLKVLRAHLKRLEEHHERVKSLVKSGGASQLESLESAYQLNEAYRLILETEAGLPAAAQGGGGFVEGGGADLAVFKRLVIKTMPGDEKRNQAILAKLEERVSMNFPSDTPLEDVKKYIEQSTQDEAAGLPTGIPIYVDPVGLQDADKTMASTVSLNLEGIPLRTTLKLMLHQLRLAYKVEGGLLIITDEETAETAPGGR